MAACVVSRIDDAYRDDDRAAVPLLELMGGPANLEGPVFWIHPERVFHELAARWRDETRYSSSLREIVQHDAYQKIIGMGRAVLPLLLAELEKPDPAHWGSALSAITGAQPVPEEAAGRPDRIALAWLEWANARGHRSG